MSGEHTRDIQIRSERLAPSEEYKGKYYIYVRVFLEETHVGPGSVTLDDIDYVLYKLHPTFKSPLRRSDKRTANFEIKIWTYGWFYISATIITKKGLPMQVKGKVEFEPTPEERAANGDKEFKW